jgi:predicted GIY-YIG superfamily endonuclease
MYVYILESRVTADRFYVGLTDNLDRRLAEHNDGKTFSTRDDRPWKIASYFWFENADTAARFEKYLKSGSGRAFAKSHFS